MEKGKSVAHVHIKYLNPFPANLEKVLRSYKKLLIPEMNLGQLAYILRATYMIDGQTFAKVQGLPFGPTEIEEEALKTLESM